jgi:hypothetical protein
MTDQPNRPRHQTTDDVMRRAAPGEYRKPQRRSWQPTVTGIFLILGWVALLYGTSQPLLATIQIDALGIGAVITAIVMAVWPGGGS